MLIFYNLGKTATKHDFKVLHFESISILYMFLNHMLISSYNAMAQGAY